MLQGWVIVLVSFAYLGLLFAVAFYGDKRADQGRSIIANPLIFAVLEHEWQARRNAVDS